MHLQIRISRRLNADDACRSGMIRYLVLTTSLVVVTWSISGCSTAEPVQTAVFASQTAAFSAVPVSSDSGNCQCVASTYSRTKDLGTIDRDVVPRCRFLIRNETNRPFTVLEYQKSCGCEAADVGIGTSVAVGEALTVMYELPRHGGGNKQGRLTITTDSVEPRFRTIQLNLKARHPRVIWAAPSALYFEECQAGDVRRVTLHSDVTGLFANPVEITASRGLVKIDVIERTAQQVTIDVKPNAIHTHQESFDLIRVEVADEQNTSLSIRVRTRARTSVPARRIPRASGTQDGIRMSH